ncbi:MAG: hypothetical protein K5656_08160 [Lachnospiraceae bacterium]|nr:hypothetical protein [Lachnospiraceae bacterium]
MENVIVCLKDEEYLCSFVNSINKYSRGEFMAFGISDDEALRDFVMNKKASLIICEDQTSLDLDDDIFTAICFISLTKNKELKDHEMNYYLKAKVYVDEIKARLSISNSEIKLYNNLAVISFTNYHETLIRINKYCKEDETVIWNYTPFKRTKNEGDVDTFLYSIKLRDDAVSDKLKSALSYEGEFKMLDSPNSYADLNEFDYEDISFALKKTNELNWSLVALLDIACLKELKVIDAFDKVLLIKSNENGEFIKRVSESFENAGIIREKIKIVD